MGPEIEIHLAESSNLIGAVKILKNTGDKKRTYVRCATLVFKLSFD